MEAQAQLSPAIDEKLLRELSLEFSPLEVGHVSIHQARGLVVFSSWACFKVRKSAPVSLCTMLSLPPAFQLLDWPSLLLLPGILNARVTP